MMGLKIVVINRVYFIFLGYVFLGYSCFTVVVLLLFVGTGATIEVFGLRISDTPPQKFRFPSSVVKKRVLAS